MATPEDEQQSGTESTPESEQTPVADATIVAAAAESFIAAGGATLDDHPTESPVDEQPRICPTVTIENAFKAPSGKEKDTQIPIALLNVTFSDFNTKGEAYPNFNVEGNTKARQWANTIRAAIPHLMLDDMFVKAANREGSDWQQSIESGGVKLNIGRPQFAASSDGKLVGEQAVIKFQTAMNLGSMIQVPLWHSGIWVSLKAPSDAQLLILERAQADEKISLGRKTQGLVYAHSSIYMINHLMGLLIDQIYNTSLKDHKDEKLLDVIKITDIPTLVWALACTIYPNGYTFHNPCIDNPEKCQHVVEERLILSKLFFFDRSGITSEQGMFMADRLKMHTLPEVQQYQTKGRGADGRVIELNDQFKMVLKVPTIREYIDSGFKWVEGIVQTIDKTMTGSMNSSEKDKYITQHSIVSIYRQYAHWVERIVFRDNDVIEDRETIEETLTMLSSDVDLYQKFFEGVKNYIDDCTVSMIALPSYNCPSCHKPMTPPESKHPFLIPLDVISLFFTLTHRRLDRTRLLETE